MDERNFFTEKRQVVLNIKDGKTYRKRQTFELLKKDASFK